MSQIINDTIIYQVYKVKMYGFSIYRRIRIRVYAIHTIYVHAQPYFTMYYLHYNIICKQ